MQEFQINVSEEAESSSDNLQKTISFTLSDLYRIEALFHAISLISEELTCEGITGQPDVSKATESIYAIACQGAEFCLKVANRLDRAEMASRSGGES